MADTKSIELPVSATNLVYPKDRLEGLKENWKNDLISGFIVFLIALPLSLGIAMASGCPPLAGIFAAIVGGIIVSQLSGSHVVINGPAAGLITIVAASVDRLGGGVQGYHNTLAAIVVAGGILTILGLLKAGELGYFFPSSVIHGMLAAIGLIIMIKQFPIMVGAIVPKEIAKEPLKTLLHAPDIISGLNPEIALIGIISLLVLIVHASIKHPMAKNVPAPIIVVAIAMGLGALFQLDAEHNYSFWGHLFSIHPSKVLVVIPNNPMNGICFPDWGKVSQGAFWLSAISIALVQGIETLLTAAAVSEKVDIFRRPVNLSRDVASVGAATIVSGAIGGLPMIAEIVRSKANVMVGAKTRWSNFFHGCFILAFALS